MKPPMLDTGINFIKSETDAACSVGPGPSKCMTLVCGGKVKMEVCNDVRTHPSNTFHSPHRKLIQSALDTGQFHVSPKMHRYRWMCELDSKGLSTLKT